MAYVTRRGTTVLHPDAIRHAIIAESYTHGDPSVLSEYRVYKRFSVRGEQFAEEGDTLMARNSEVPPSLRERHPGGLAWVCNLTNGLTKLVPWETMAHSVKPVEAVIA